MNKGYGKISKSPGAKNLQSQKQKQTLHFDAKMAQNYQESKQSKNNFQIFFSRNQPQTLYGVSHNIVAKSFKYPGFWLERNFSSFIPSSLTTLSD